MHIHSDTVADILGRARNALSGLYAKTPDEGAAYAGMLAETLGGEARRIRTFAINMGLYILDTAQTTRHPSHGRTLEESMDVLDAAFDELLMFGPEAGSAVLSAAACSLDEALLDATRQESAQMLKVVEMVAGGDEENARTAMTMLAAWTMADMVAENISERMRSRLVVWTEAATREALGEMVEDTAAGRYRDAVRRAARKAQEAAGASNGGGRVDPFEAEALAEMVTECAEALDRETLSRVLQRTAPQTRRVIADVLAETLEESGSLIEAAEASFVATGIDMLFEAEADGEDIDWGAALGVALGEAATLGDIHNAHWVLLEEQLVEALEDPELS